MTSTRVLFALFLAFTLCGAPALPSLHAQSADTREAQIEEWWEDLLLEGGDVGNQAAYELFYREIEPERLLGVMRGKNKKARVGILTAIKMAGRKHATTAFQLAEAGLGDPDPEIDSLSVRAIGLLEEPETYKLIGAELLRLRDARADSREGKVALGLVEAVGRLRRPMRATGVLVDVLSQRMSPTLEQAVRQVLEQLTAHTFATPAKWRKWWEGVLELRMEEGEWRAEVAKRRAESVRQTRAVAANYYSRTLEALADKPKLLLRELARGLEEERIPSIPKRAVVELGKLGRIREGASAEEKEVRAEAVQVLLTRLRQTGGAEFDPLKSDLLSALGRTHDATVLSDLLRFLQHDNPRMRIAAVAAIADLRAAEAIPSLLEQINGEQDAQLVLAALDALGQIGKDALINPGPPPFRVSDRLTQFCEGILAANGEAGPEAPAHLAAAAWSLGALDRDQPPSVKEVDLLGRLAAHVDPNVRFKAVGALGALRSEGAFAFLEKRLLLEPAIHVKKAILNAIGRQALSEKALKERAVAQLVPFLFEAREDMAALQQAARDRLLQLAQIDPELLALSAIVREIEKDRDPKAALQTSLPFLGLLPTREGAKKLEGTARERYLTLLTKRALARLDVDPQRALSELEEVLTGRGWLTVGQVNADSFPVFFGRARALLLVQPPRAKQAFTIAEVCLKHEASEATWTLVLDAIEAMPKGDPKARAELLDRLSAAIEKAPDAIKERYARLRKEIAAPKDPTPTPEGPTPKSGETPTPSEGRSPSEGAPKQPGGSS